LFDPHDITDLKMYFTVKTSQPLQWEHAEMPSLPIHFQHSEKVFLN